VCGCGDGICLECQCASSCTLGYYKQNTCNWPAGITPTTTFPCYGSMTFLQALKCQGSAKDNPQCRGTLTAQQAAALLNLAEFGCTGNPDLDTQAEICASTSTSALDAINQHDPTCCATRTCADNSVCVIGRTCPLQGCGR
jgi:hypothetical protein